jgi:hypothetical protein
MRIQSGHMISLGYATYVRSDDILAVEPVRENRGPGRRCLVWVRGVPDPIIASRSANAIMADLAMPAEKQAPVVLGRVAAARDTTSRAKSPPRLKAPARRPNTGARRHPRRRNS